MHLPALVLIGTIATVQAGVTLEKRAVTLFTPNGKFDYQLGGAYTPPSGTVTVVRDRTASVAPNLYNICYINAFQTQPNENDFWKTNHDEVLLRNSTGQYFIDPGWPDEIQFNTTTAQNRNTIAGVLNGWIDDCATKGFKGIEPDNLDTFTRSDNLLTRENNFALAALIATHAHNANLAIAQKNLADEAKAAAGFDFAIAEECQAETECEEYTAVYGDFVLEIEYTDRDDPEQIFQDVCDARGTEYSIILRDRFLVTPSEPDYHYEEC
ncbi:glycoside hydrolase family 114 protein [Ephemerocybe angulata]|uniref:alpha-galactosidase n=1 Tax=Ephemerocybe angulata TaxID=980116 RepID=A0A8H6LUH7_9AGAR|nr:glycoside hydrolase family 114 protein [Tulosesus angulatus]